MRGRVHRLAAAARQAGGGAPGRGRLRPRARAPGARLRQAQQLGRGACFHNPHCVCLLLLFFSFFRLTRFVRPRPKRRAPRPPPSAAPPRRRRAGGRARRRPPAAARCSAAICRTTAPRSSSTRCRSRACRRPFRPRSSSTRATWTARPLPIVFFQNCSAVTHAKKKKLARLSRAGLQSAGAHGLTQEQQQAGAPVAPGEARPCPPLRPPIVVRIWADRSRPAELIPLGVAKWPEGPEWAA